MSYTLATSHECWSDNAINILIIHCYFFLVTSIHSLHSKRIGKCFIYAYFLVVNILSEKKRT